jgi:PAS domain S-box-containing protein
MIKTPKSDRESLLREIAELRRRVAELERLEAARRQVQEDFRNERDLAQRYLDIAGVILLGLDERARATLINRKGCEILGYKEEEVLGKSWIHSFVPVRFRDEVSDVFGKVMAGEMELAEYHENPVLRKDGSERLIAWHNAVLRDAGGKIVGTLSSGEDVTERRRVEAALNESEARLRGIFKVAPVGIGLVSADRVILEVNDRVCEMLGYSREELVGRGARMIYASDEDFEYVGREKYAQIDKLGMGNVETRWKRKDGKIVDVLLRSAPIDPSNRSAGTTFTALDITELKRIRGKMDRLNRLFLSMGADLMENMEKILLAAREITECAHAAFSVLTRDRLSTLSTLPGEEGLLVTTRAEGMVSYDLIRRADREILIIPDLQETEYATTDPLVAKHGFRSYIGYPVMVEGRTVGCLSLFGSAGQDFSAADVELAGMLAQALSVEQERLDREEELKDFIDIASHEIRHPITIIKGYALTLRELWNILDENRRQELLDAIDQGAERLNRLSTGLLDVSRIERGFFKIDKEATSLKSLLEGAVSGMREAGHENPCRLSVTEGVGTVSIDPGRMRTVLFALLENAVRYSPKGSEIEVVAERSKEEVVVSVLDRGVGVPEKEREKIFERFYQLEDALHHSLPGMGVGLFLARQIVEAHGGRIWHEPREGGGSAFRFTIPLK